MSPGQKILLNSTHIISHYFQEMSTDITYYKDSLNFQSTCLLNGSWTRTSNFDNNIHLSSLWTQLQLSLINFSDVCFHLLSSNVIYNH
jgi:hypothetical protein